MGPCSLGNLTSVSPNGPLALGDLQARSFRAEKLTGPLHTSSGPAFTLCAHGPNDHRDFGRLCAHGPNDHRDFGRRHHVALRPLVPQFELDLHLGSRLPGDPAATGGRTWPWLLLDRCRPRRRRRGTPYRRAGGHVGAFSFRVPRHCGRRWCLRRHHPQQHPGG